MASLKIVVIGASGFLGKAFARRLAELDQLHVSPKEVLPISTVILFDLDVSFYKDHPLKSKKKWTAQQGNLTDHQTVRELIAPENDSQRVVVFLFATVLSGKAEDNFELGLEVNLRAPLALLEELTELGKRLGRAQTLVYTSSNYVACYNETNRKVPFSEEGFRLSPTSYGVQKACVELLISDFARKGFVDGRVGRISTIIGRPDFVNSVSYTFSAIIAQPLKSQDCKVPLPMDASLPCSVLENNVECLLQLAGKISGEQIGHNRVIQLPARSFTLTEIWNATKTAAERHGIQLGCLEFGTQSDAATTIKQIDGVPRVDCEKARRLGLPQDVSLESVIENFIQREGLVKSSS